MRLTPMIMRVRLGSLFSGRTLQTLGVSDFLSAVGGDIFKADEEEGFGYLDTLASDVGGGADALADPAKFFGVGLVPDFVEI